MRLNEFTPTDQFVLNAARSVGFGYAVIHDTAANRGPVVVGVAGTACTIETRDLRSRVLPLSEIEGLA
jgi:hypothetical protein